MLAVEGRARVSDGCRMCGSPDLVRYLDLGLHPLADEFRTPAQAAGPQVYYPLEVCLCQACGLSQLGLLVDPALLFQQDYPYEASTTATGRAHYQALARSVVERFSFGAGDLAVDIGSNVGVLVKAFMDAGLWGLGIDPAPNMVARARDQGVDTLCGFFGHRLAVDVRGMDGPAAVITGTNVFAHIHDLDSFITGLATLLDRRGVIVLESPHFLQLVRQLEYDTIYHEHVSYLSLKPLVACFARYGLEVFDVEMAGIHGGSMRVFIGWQGEHALSPNVAALLEEEARAGIHDLDVLRVFATRVAQHRTDLLMLLRSLKVQGKRLAGVSAPAKGMTLLNYCGIGDLLEFVTEKAPLKLGRVTPGGRLPILPDCALWEQGIDYGLVLAWNFANEIMANNREFREQGGQFILPIPRPRVVRGSTARVA